MERITQGDEGKILNQFESVSISCWIQLDHKVGFNCMMSRTKCPIFSYLYMLNEPVQVCQIVPLSSIPRWFADALLSAGWVARE